MSDDPELSRRRFLSGLGAATAASAAPTDIIEAAVKAAGETLHPLAAELATNVWQLHEPYQSWDGPNDFQDLRAEAIQYLTDLPDTWAKKPEIFADEIRAWRDAARLLESGWTPPAYKPSTIERDTPALEGETSPERPLESVPATRTVTLAEHIDELRAELRGSLDSRERTETRAELEAAHKALKEQEGRSLFPDITPNQPSAGDATIRREDIDTAVTRLSSETGLPYTPAAEGEFVAGIYRQSLTLTSGRFAMIDNGLGFALVPWTKDLDLHLDRHVTGVAQESGGIEWSFARKRGLEI